MPNMFLSMTISCFCTSGWFLTDMAVIAIVGTGLGHVLTLLDALHDVIQKDTYATSIHERGANKAIVSSRPQYHEIEEIETLKAIPR